jgi:beta-glucanase (GH16 family)
MFSVRNARGLSFAIPALAALAVAGCGSQSTVGSSGSSTPNETLVWSDEFNQSNGSSQPDSSNWAYRTGAGNSPELEIYCNGEASVSPCNSTQPNAYVGSDGYLHIVARQAAANTYTSAMLWTQGLQSFQYGRIEARMKLPSVPGFWPAFWMLGNNFSQVSWPECGEIDVMETHALSPAMVVGSIHGFGFVGQQIGHSYVLPASSNVSSDFHTYGILWSPQKLEFYVDDPTNVYNSFTPESLPPGAIWPFDSQKFFLVLNMSVWAPASAGQEEMLVDYVRVWDEQTAKTNE